MTRIGEQHQRTLVAAARDGSTAAFSDLVDLHYAVLHRYEWRLWGEDELAADLTQDAFLAAWRRLDDLAEDRSFAAWLYQIGRHRWYDELRRRRRLRWLSLDWLLGHARTQQLEPHAPDLAHEQAQRDLFQRALYELSPTLREALLLNRLWGFTGHEIAKILNISVAAARKRVGRAHDDFRNHYRTMQRSGQS
jgi:RNA polymerase sigma-70 factor, ECF subfamily